MIEALFSRFVISWGAMMKDAGYDRFRKLGYECFVVPCRSLDLCIMSLRRFVQGSSFAGRRLYAGARRSSHTNNNTALIKAERSHDSVA
jgi:hypothetical protein